MKDRVAVIDVNTLLDRHSWSGLQKRFVLVVALAVVIDGFDNQVLGLTIPSLSAEWHVGREAFALVLALGIIGLSIGTALGGWLGDRFGRRTVLIGSVLVFGGVTAATCWVEGITQLTALRVLTGLGLGGAMPNATALLTEYTPARRQTLAVTLGIACIPLGGLIGGYLSAHLIPAFGWRSLYVFGGIAPMAVAAALGWGVPESPRFLASRPATWPRLATLLNRLLGKPMFSADTRFSNSLVEVRVPFKAILSGEFRHDTLALWAAFFTNLLAVYMFFNWMPTMLSLLNLRAAQVGIGAALFNLGSLAGALLGAGLMSKLGAKLIITCLCSGAVVGGLIFGMLHNATVLFALLAFMGACTSGLQILLFAVAARLYPTLMRSTGIGSALALGRLGAIVSSFAGTLMLELDASGKPFFWFVSTVMLLTLISVLQIRNLTLEAPRSP